MGRTSTLRLRRVRFHRTDDELLRTEKAARTKFFRQLSGSREVKGALRTWNGMGSSIEIYYADDPTSDLTRAQGWVS